MAETQTAATPNAEKSADGGRRSPQSVEETRTFKPDARQAPAAAVAVRAAEAGRQIAETGRYAAETWRATLDPLAAMQMEMNRWFDEAVRHMAGFGFFPPLLAARPFAGASPGPLFGLPPTDVKETKDAYVLAVELPGLAREDVEVALDGDRITLCGHKAEDRAEATASYRISERRFGHFERSFPIPDDVARSEIEAAFKDGLLKITLPRQDAASAKRSRIEIHG